ncbi:hypothetical protein FACS1894184_08040 [Clostridia bacterium]|nr:hypothetical protein FACS1894184_08040 [Clostridia bacterium]
MCRGGVAPAHLFDGIEFYLRDADSEPIALFSNKKEERWLPLLLYRFGLLLQCLLIQYLDLDVER